MNDITNEELHELWLDSGRDVFKYGRLVIARIEQRKMFPGIVPNTNSNQFDMHIYGDPHAC